MSGEMSPEEIARHATQRQARALLRMLWRLNVLRVYLNHSTQEVHRELGELGLDDEQITAYLKAYQQQMQPQQQEASVE